MSRDLEKWYKHNIGFPLLLHFRVIIPPLWRLAGRLHSAARVLFGKPVASRLRQIVSASFGNPRRIVESLLQ